MCLLQVGTYMLLEQLRTFPCPPPPLCPPSGTLSYFLHHDHTLYSVQYANSRVESIWHHFQNNFQLLASSSSVLFFSSQIIIPTPAPIRQQSPLHPRQAMDGVQPGTAHCPTCNSVLVFGKKFCKDCGSPTASVWLAIQKEQLAKEAAAKQQPQAAAAAAAAEDAAIVKGRAQAKVDAAAAAAAIPNGALYPLLPTTEAYTYTKGPAAPAVVDLYSSNSSINSHRDLTLAQAPAAYASPTSSAPTYKDPQSVTQSVFTRLDSASWVLQLVVSGVQLACLVLYIRWVNRDLEQVKWWRVCAENQEDTSPYYGSCHSTIFYLIASVLSVLMAIFTPNPCSAKSGNAGVKFCFSTKNPTPIPLLVNSAVFALNSFEALMNYDGTNIYLTSVGGALSLALAIVYSIKICGCCPSCTAVVILNVDEQSDTEPLSTSKP